MHYRTPDNKLYFIEPGEEALLPSDSVLLSDADAEAFRQTQLPVIDPKVDAQEQIDRLEKRELLPRVVREYMLGDFAAKAQAAGQDPMLLPAYAKLKALDNQIKVLRAKTK